MHLFHVGLGSGGMATLDLLARDARLTRATLVDFDTFDAANVARHLFAAAGIGRLKLDLAREWLADRRPDLLVEGHAVDVTDAAVQPALVAALATAQLAVCAVDGEPAKYHCDRLFRAAGVPWTLGEVLSGGVAGWVHRFRPGGACYGCVASRLQRDTPIEAADPLAPRPAYADPGAERVQERVPAGRASISAIASLQALVTLELLEPPGPGEFTSLLMPLARVEGVFREPFAARRLAIARDPDCLVCGALAARPKGDLDAQLDDALARLAGSGRPPPAE